MTVGDGGGVPSMIHMVVNMVNLVVTMMVSVSVVDVVAEGKRWI